MTSQDLAPCRCSTGACRDCGWSGLTIEWPQHHDDQPWHRFRAGTPFCGETPCRTVAAELALDGPAQRGE